MGLSPVASVMREVYTDNEIANYSALLMKNGAVPPVVISLKENVNAYQFDPNDVRDKYLRQTQGDQRGKAWVSGAAVNVEKVGFSPNDLNLAQLRRLPGRAPQCGDWHPGNRAGIRRRIGQSDLL